MTDLVIETHGLSKSYNGVDALTGLDLTVPRHSIVGFLGPNGAGKSTTIKLLLGLIRPTAGSGTVFGLDIVHDSLAIRRRVGYLAQQPRYDERLTAREVLRLVADLFYSGPRDAVEARIAESLELVGLADKADRLVKGFSGGEMQRLGIAQAQINHPDLLILDEPAAALDPMGRADVLHIMECLRAHSTIFYSTHILDDVQRVSDHVVILNRGKLVAQGPIDTLLAARAADAPMGRTIYTIDVRGTSEARQAAVLGQPWVTTLDIKQANGYHRWRVAVTDDAAAEAQLLRLLLAGDDLNVVQFGREQMELEDVFMELVKGAQQR